MEQASVEGADRVHPPTHHCIGYMESRGWKLPAARFITQNLLPVRFCDMPVAIRSDALERRFGAFV